MEVKYTKASCRQRQPGQKLIKFRVTSCKRVTQRVLQSLVSNIVARHGFPYPIRPVSDIGVSERFSAEDGLFSTDTASPCPCPIRIGYGKVAVSATSGAVSCNYGEQGWVEMERIAVTGVLAEVGSRIPWRRMEA